MSKRNIGNAHAPVLLPQRARLSAMEQYQYGHVHIGENCIKNRWPVGASKEANNLTCPYLLNQHPERQYVVTLHASGPGWHERTVTWDSVHEVWRLPNSSDRVYIDPNRVDKVRLARSPIRCAAWCHQYPNCQHDWSSWEPQAPEKPAEAPEKPVGEADEQKAIRDSLRRLVLLKDGPRDEWYKSSKDEAWAKARTLLGMEQPEEKNRSRSPEMAETITAMKDHAEEFYKSGPYRLSTRLFPNTPESEAITAMKDHAEEFYKSGPYRLVKFTHKDGLIVPTIVAHSEPTKPQILEKQYVWMGAREDGKDGVVVATTAERAKKAVEEKVSEYYGRPITWKAIPCHGHPDLLQYEASFSEGPYGATFLYVARVEVLQ